VVLAGSWADRASPPNVPITPQILLHSLCPMSLISLARVGHLTSGATTSCFVGGGGQRVRGKQRPDRSQVPSKESQQRWGSKLLLPTKGRDRFAA
jgi:hypothetical protein